MAQEIERKFLTNNDRWKKGLEGRLFRQGYLSLVKERTVRVRLVGDLGLLTIKGITQGITRREYEYEIPADEAAEMLDNLCERPLIEKTRYLLDDEGFRWEIDEFHGENAGLVVAEIELESEGQDFPRPDWLGEEVSGDPRYFNSNLISHPFSQW